MGGGGEDGVRTCSSELESAMEDNLPGELVLIVKGHFISIRREL